MTSSRHQARPTPADVDFGGCLSELADRGLLPARYEAAFVVGSMARGWANPGSDLDLYVVTYLTEVERLLLARIPHAVPLNGARWLSERRDRLHTSAFRTICVTGALGEMNDCAEDAVGLLEGGDWESAVVSAKEAFQHGVDALLAHYGEMGGTKWRARAFRTVNPPQMPFDDYWAIETMAGFAAGDPRTWVEHVLAACQRISMTIEISPPGG